MERRKRNNNRTKWQNKQRDTKAWKNPHRSIHASCLTGSHLRVLLWRSIGSNEGSRKRGWHTGNTRFAGSQRKGQFSRLLLSLPSAGYPATQWRHTYITISRIQSHEKPRADGRTDERRPLFLFLPFGRMMEFDGKRRIWKNITATRSNEMDGPLLIPRAFHLRIGEKDRRSGWKERPDARRRHKRGGERKRAEEERERESIFNL